MSVPDALKSSVVKLEAELVATHGEAQRARIQRGLAQAASFWRATDGDAAAFEACARGGFIADPGALDATFARLEAVNEEVGGYMLELTRFLREPVDLDRGPILPVDEILAGWEPAAHFSEDMFANRLAFTVLLNFPLTTLDERLAGDGWSRRQWAEARLAQGFGRRVPGEVTLAIGQASAAAERYIADYNIWMHHLLDDQGGRLFPAGLRLISHWNLRDELKADYADGATGLAKQRLLQKVMERIVDQTIPASVIDDPTVDWNPRTNAVRRTTVRDSDRALPSRDPSPGREPDTRYERLLDIFHAVRQADAYSPAAPTLIARRFDENREISEPRVRQMLEAVLGSPLVPRVAALVQARLGRALEPFDIWYNGFTPRGRYTEGELDAIVAKRYPTADAYAADMPNLFRRLGFTPERSDFLAGRIVVDASRGAGHAMAAERREDKVHLRTRVEKGGMDYKGYNIAVHEMGHNVEQVISLDLIDHTLLKGVPNNAFTEALAFVFQSRDLELLGLASPDPKSAALSVLNEFWVTYEIAGVALVDMGVWHWMYDHPDAKPAELREATIRISKEIWNRFYAPVFKRSDVTLLGIYSHMISNTLYLPDYPLGHLIAFQIEEQVRRAGNLGTEFERMARIGSVTPDLWMKTATGAPVGPEALLRATEKALADLDRRPAP
jgi:hypothetical protein